MAELHEELAIGPWPGRRARLLAATLISAFALAVCSCGGPGEQHADPAPAPAPATGAGTPFDVYLGAFMDCMRRAGFSPAVRDDPNVVFDGAGALVVYAPGDQDAPSFASSRTECDTEAHRAEMTAQAGGAGRPGG